MTGKSELFGTEGSISSHRTVDGPRNIGPARRISQAGPSGKSSARRDRFRQMDFLLVRVFDMHATAVWPKQVKLGTHRAALRMWIPEDDSACMVWHVLYSFQTSRLESARAINSYASKPIECLTSGGISRAEKLIALRISSSETLPHPIAVPRCYYR
jgi:hypothetical protein